MNPNNLKIGDIKIGDIIRYSDRGGVKITEIILKKDLFYFETFCLNNNTNPKLKKMILKLNFNFVSQGKVEIIS